MEKAVLEAKELNGLNPYYNGRYSWSFADGTKALLSESLNPYYNGRYSWRASIM